MPLFSVPNFSAPVANAQNCPSNSILKMTLPAAPDSFNFLTTGTYGGYYVIGMEYSGIFPVPDLTGQLQWSNSIVDWIKSNQNYTQWTVNVKPGLRWSNGQNVTAQDILGTYSPQFAFNPNYDFVNAHAEVASEVSLNSSTVEFNLNVSDAHFIEDISELVLTTVYSQSVTSQGANNSNLQTNVVVGPFYVEGYTPGQTQLVMLRNPYFQPLPSACEIIVNFVETQSQTAAYIQSGASDLAPIDSASAPTLLKNPSIHINPETSTEISFIQYNTTSYPYNMTNFRKAIAESINYSQILQQAFFGYGSPGNIAEGTVPSTVTKLYNPNITKYDYNQTEALTLLQSIGITKGSDGFLHYPNGTDITLSFISDDTFSQDAVAAGIVKQDLQSLGFQVNFLITQWSNIATYYSSNTNDIQHSMTLLSTAAPEFGDAWVDAQPGWNIYLEMGTVVPPYWEYPPSADALYQSNLTALDSTGNSSLVDQYLNNIQSINSQYLPVIVVGYPDYLWAYNTQHWTNWPSGSIVYTSNWFNFTSLAAIQPVSQTTTASTNLTTTTASTSLTTSTTTSTFSSASQTTTSSTAQPNYTLVAAAVIIILVVAASIAIFQIRRR